MRPMELVGAYDSIVEEGGGVRFHFVLLDFLCQIVGGRLRPGSDASATEWVPLADLEEVDLTPLARTAILEAVRLRDRPGRELALESFSPWMPSPTRTSAGGGDWRPSEPTSATPTAPTRWASLREGGQT